MKDVFRIITLVIQNISLIFMMILGVVGALSELLDPPFLEKLFAKINITWNLKVNIIIFLITIFIYAGTSLLLKKID